MTFNIIITDYTYPDLKIERNVLSTIDATVTAIDATTSAEIVERATDADALINQQVPIDEDVFEALSNLQVVARYGVGVDNVDLSAATEHGITVANVPSYCEEEVSTHALALLLAVTRNVVSYDGHVGAGGWDWKVGAPIHRLEGKTLGLVAFGAIPQALRQKVRGFDLEILAYDEYLSTDVFEAHDVEQVSFRELLERSDAVSVHAPLTEETENLFDREAFAAMRSSAVLVNTARGPIVDEQALAEAVRDGEIAGAGIDVFPDEPPSNSSLFDLDKVVCTPHVAWYSEESLTELRRKTAENVARVLKGDDPINRVNTPVAD